MKKIFFLALLAVTVMANAQKLDVESVKSGSELQQFYGKEYAYLFQSEKMYKATVRNQSGELHWEVCESCQKNVQPSGVGGGGFIMIQNIDFAENYSKAIEGRLNDVKSAVQQNTEASLLTTEAILAGQKKTDQYHAADLQYSESNRIHNQNVEAHNQKVEQYWEKTIKQNKVSNGLNGVNTATNVVNTGFQMWGFFRGLKGRGSSYYAPSIVQPTDGFTVGGSSYQQQQYRPTEFRQNSAPVVTQNTTTIIPQPGDGYVVKWIP